MNDVQYAVGADEAEIRRVADELFMVNSFRYYSKLTRGNDAVRTHTA
jgi:hypothetical protein